MGMGDFLSWNYAVLIILKCSFNLDIATRFEGNVVT